MTFFFYEDHEALVQHMLDEESDRWRHGRCGLVLDHVVIN
jgi:hypothetical protein